MSVANRATRSAISVQLVAVPLVFLILVSDLPIRRADLADIFFRVANGWSVFYLPLPILAGVGLLHGIGGVLRGIPTGQGEGSAIGGVHISRALRNMVLFLPLFMAAWIVVAIMFVAFIPEVV